MSEQSTVAGTLRQIYIYPIKSLPGILLDKAIITPNGIAHPDNTDVIDRKWMVIRESGSFVTQRQLPEMALLKTQLDGDQLVISAPGREDLRIPVKPPTTQKLNCRVWDRYPDAYLYGGHISEWLTSFLGLFMAEKLDLACIDMSTSNMNKWDADILLQDEGSFMLITEKSLEDLNERLTKNAIDRVNMQNFRPNFIVETDAGPFVEDTWGDFKIGSAMFKTLKPCTRCIFTTVDPKRGVKHPDQQPLKMLREYRMDKEKYGTSPMFGSMLKSKNDENDNNLSVSVGDKVFA